MEWRRQREVERLVSALAFDSLDGIHLLKDGRDKLLERLEVRILWQVAEHVGEVDARIVVHHLDKYLAEDGPAKFARFIGQLGHPIGLEQLQGIDDALEEHG